LTSERAISSSASLSEKYQIPGEFMAADCWLARNVKGKTFGFISRTRPESRKAIGSENFDGFYFQVR
jgi:hypothetical protein